MADPESPVAGSRADSRSATASPHGGIDVGLLVLHSPQTDPDRLHSFATQLASDAAAELESATDVDWEFFTEESARLSDASPRRPSQFLDEATHRMVEGPYDIVVVVADVTVVSSRERIIPGTASPLGRVAVISTDRLSRTGRDQPRRSLDAPATRWNGATLLLHLLGHVLGAGHSDADGGVMRPFHVDADRDSVPAFDARVERHLHRIADEIPEADAIPKGPLGRVGFHLRSAARNPGQVLRALWHSRAPLLPFSLPKLATAAVTPTLVIVFSAEAWDVGFHLSNGMAAMFATVSVVAAAVYLLFAQNLSFPRKRHRVVTEHTALVNVTVFCILLAAMVGLFALVASIILLIEFVVFPPNLMSNWPSLENPTVGVGDLVRTGVFISSIGVLSGALAGGLESRLIVRHLTLFLDRP